MPNDVEIPARLRWARFRFGVVAPLLTVPPEHGELAAQLAELATRSWPHPTTGESMRLSVKTIERWLYVARSAPQPLEALARKVPKHAGTHPAVSEAVGAVIKLLRLEHPRWSYQLVHDNLGAVARERGDLGQLPSYQTVCRYMKHVWAISSAKATASRVGARLRAEGETQLRGGACARVVALRLSQDSPQGASSKWTTAIGDAVCDAR
jgi:putative transposase